MELVAIFIIKDIHWWSWLIKTENLSKICSPKEPGKGFDSDAEDAGLGDRFMASVIELHKMRRDRDK
jgi:hypothetical protein